MEPVLDRAAGVWQGAANAEPVGRGRPGGCRGMQAARYGSSADAPDARGRSRRAHGHEPTAAQYPPGAALNELNPDQRRALEPACFSGLSDSELAPRLAVPVGTVKTRIRLGLMTCAYCDLPGNLGAIGAFPSRAEAAHHPSLPADRIAPKAAPGAGAGPGSRWGIPAFWGPGLRDPAVVRG
jgi:hypothetical protein